jgi:hypothetical protein
MTTWTTDARALTPTLPEAQSATEPRTAFLRALAEAATSRSTKDAWCCAVRCIAVVGRKTCRARIHVAEPGVGRVEWSCATCGERGTITGCGGTDLDLSSYVPRRMEVKVWGFDDKSRDVLLAATTHIPSLRAVIARASPAAEIEGLLILQATLDELDEIYTLVEQLTDATRSRRRIELLDGLRADLCGAMDSFLGSS